MFSAVQLQTESPTHPWTNSSLSCHVQLSEDLMLSHLQKLMLLHTHTRRVEKGSKLALLKFLGRTGQASQASSKQLKRAGQVASLAFTVVWVGPVTEFLGAGSSLVPKKGAPRPFLTACIDGVTKTEGWDPKAISSQISKHEVRFLIKFAEGNYLHLK